MKQRLAHELLDDDLGTPAEISRSLDDLWQINQHLGGISSWKRLIPLFPPAASLLDIGSGRGELAAWLAQRLGARAVSLDRRSSHLGASHGGSDRLAGDALQLPFSDASFDLVACNLFLHHFHGDAARRLLDEMHRVARRAVVVNDLERAWLPYFAIRALGLRFSRITRHDGPRSVRQAYTARELQSLAPAARVVRLWPYRLGMVWLK